MIYDERENFVYDYDCSDKKYDSYKLFVYSLSRGMEFFIEKMYWIIAYFLF